MTLIWFTAGVVVGWVTMLILIAYVGRQRRRQQATAMDKLPQLYECEVCGLSMGTWDHAKAHAVESHNAITEETWTDIIKGVE